MPQSQSDDRSEYNLGEYYQHAHWLNSSYEATQKRRGRGKAKQYVKHLVSILNSGWIALSVPVEAASSLQ